MKQILLFSLIIIFTISASAQRGNNNRTQSVGSSPHYAPIFHSQPQQNHIQNRGITQQSRVQNGQNYQHVQGHPNAPIVANRKSFQSYRWHGTKYHYYSGFYYDRFYNPIFPPYGFFIPILPIGYWSFYYDDIPYYYYEGVYYEPYANGYQVVEPPIGSIVPTLPDGCKAVILNGITYYVIGNFYYQEVEVNGIVEYKLVSECE